MLAAARTISHDETAELYSWLIRDERCRPDHPLGDAIEVLIRREDAEQFLAEVQKDDPELARHLRIVERELAAGNPN